MSRKKPDYPNVKCEVCGIGFKPASTLQRFCPACGKEQDRLRKQRWYKAHNPNAYQEKEKKFCCICGKPFSSNYNGKPYCNLHWLRMYNNGTPELVGRANTNSYIYHDKYTEVITSKGERILVGNCDLDNVKKHSWCISKTGYAVATINRKVVKLHRNLLHPEQSQIVDHKNGNALDNRRSNLRICSAKDNARNRVVTNKVARVSGVRKVPSGKYSCRITCNREEIYIGTFETIEKAEEQRRAVEQVAYGEFAPSVSRNANSTYRP